MRDLPEPIPAAGPESDPAQSVRSERPAAILSDDSGTSDEATSDDASSPPSRKRKGWSGWLIGIVFGVLAGLWAFPPVRYTLGAQLQFAISEDGVPWLLSLDTRRSVREASRLDAVAALEPNSEDYLLQVGRATALVEAGGMRSSSASSLSTGFTPQERGYSDHTLYRLGLITREFPDQPGAYAHLARYMMVDRVHIQRAELADSPSSARRGDRPSANNALPGTDPKRRASSVPVLSDPTVSVPAYRGDVRLMTVALQSGEKRDPDNAFWPAMLACTYFAAQDRDGDALAALARAARKTHWDAYIYEEVLGQWRLYSAAYGDHGATQKIGPLSLVAFPHLRELRRMAEMARWHAEQAAAQGRLNDAIRIRRNVALLGMILRETASWALEALYGTDIFFISATDSDSRLTPSAINNVLEWQQQATQYIALLKSAGHTFDLEWLKREVEESCALKKRVDLARYDASFPGIPPGIPLTPLFGNWVAGISLLQEMLGLAVAGGVALLLQQLFSRRRSLPRTVKAFGFALLFIVTAACGALVFTTPSPRVAGLFLVGATILLIGALNGIYEIRKPGRTAQDSKVERAERFAAAQIRWTSGTTLRMILFLLVPALCALYLLRAELSLLHPVAVLLTSLMSNSHSADVKAALNLALLASALPLSAALVSSLWALYRGLAPLAGALVGLRRLALPAIACLLIAYLLLLNRTLALDIEASRAMGEAARNDRQWVLTHSTISPF